LHFQLSSDSDALGAFGWTPSVLDRYPPMADTDREPVRVVRVDRDLCIVASRRGVVRCRLAQSINLAPATGDWGVARMGADAQLVLEDVVLRTTAVSRLNPAGDGEQVLVANVDTMFVLHGIDRPHRVGRLERLCILTWDAGADPVIVLTKIDLAGTDEAVIGVEEAVAEIERVVRGVDINPVSSTTGDGIADLAPFLAAGATVGVVGESGAGKSTLVNRLAGADIQTIGRTRGGDAKGRHTTTSRELIPLPGGAVLVDTPGLRMVAMHGGEDGLARAYEDLEALFALCRFRDCSHGTEPGCAVNDALSTGELTERRWTGYLKLLKEIEFEAKRTNERVRRAEVRAQGRRARRRRNRVEEW